MIRPFLLPLLFLLNLPAGLAQRIAPEWALKTPESMDWIAASDWGILIVGTRAKTFGVDPTDGSKLWELNEKFSDESFTVIPGTPLVYFEADDFRVLNSLTGQDLTSPVSGKFRSAEIVDTWIVFELMTEDKTVLKAINYQHPEEGWEVSLELTSQFRLEQPPIGVGNNHILYVSGDQALKLEVPTGEITWQNKSNKPIRDFFMDPTGTVAILVTGTVSNAFREERKTGGPEVTVQGNVGSFTLQGISVETGELLWSKKYRSKYSGVAKGDEDFVVFHTSSFNFLNYRSGETKWKKEPKYVGGDRNNGVLVTNEGYVVAMKDAIRDATSIYHISESGEKLWKKPVSTGPFIQYLEMTATGIFYISNTGANLIDRNTGREKWEKQLYISSGGKPFLTTENADGALFGFNQGRLIKFRPDAGDWQLVGSGFPAGGGEVPYYFRSVEDGFTLFSDQNIWKLDTEGNLVYHQYFPAPGQSLGTKLLLGAANILVSATAMTSTITAASYRLAGQLGEGDPYATRAMRARGLSELTTASSDLLSEMIRRRFTADVTTLKYKLILTERENTVQFVRVDLNTGKESGHVVTEDRSLQFHLDPYSDYLFLGKGTTLQGFYLR